MKFMKSKAGFTLVELIVVIAILGILAGIAVPAYSGYIKKAEAAGDNQIVAAVKTAVDSALVTKGTVSDISVTTGDSGATLVTASIKDGATYVLLGTTAATDDQEIQSIKDDYSLFIDNATVKFEQEVTPAGGGTKQTANTATWTTANGWVFTYVAPAAPAGT